MTILAYLLASRLYRRAIAWAATADLDARSLAAYARRMRLQLSRVLLSLLAGLAAACPKPQPEPVPAGCKPPNHCGDEPHNEGPPPVGSLDPPK